MESILHSQPQERAPHSSFPWVWFGFIFAGFFLVVEILQITLELNSESQAIFVVIFIAAWIYWLFCVYRLHSILEEITSSRYPINPGQAVGYHIIPFFNFYWVIKWPASFASYINERGRVSIAPGGLLGFLLFVSFVARFADGAIALFGMFGVLLYMSARLRKHVESISGPESSMLPPPPPDSRVFQDDAREGSG